MNDVEGAAAGSAQRPSPSWSLFDLFLEKIHANQVPSRVGQNGATDG